MDKTIAVEELYKIVRAGDILLTQNPNGLGTVIRWFQELEGDEAIYTHAALVSDSPHRIYEANTTLRVAFFKDYLNCKVCLIRNHLMTQERYEMGYTNVIRRHLGDIYPWHRLALHGLDNGFNWVFRKLGIKWRMKTAKWISFDNAVCSEWVDMFFHSLGLVKEWRGHNPDHIHDRALAHPETWRIIFEGKLVK